MNLSPAPVRTAMFENGQMTTPWIRWFDAVYSRVGGTSDPLTTEIANRASDEQPNIVVQENNYFEDDNTAAAIQASLDMVPVKSVFGRTGNVISAEGDYSLTQISDVAISSPATNDAIVYDGSNFVNEPIVNSIAGTTNQIAVSSSTGTPTISLPALVSLNSLQATDINVLSAAPTLTFTPSAGIVYDLRSGSAQFGIYDNTNAVYRLYVSDATGSVVFPNNIIASSTTTGTVVISGGLGVAGRMFSGLVQSNTATASTSKTTGSITSAGGIGANGQVSCTVLAPNPPGTKTSNYSLVATDGTVFFNGTASITLTLQAASSYPGRLLILKNIAAFTVVSASSNVVPITGGAAGTAILPATAGSWCVLQSDGTSWHTIMRG